MNTEKSASPGSGYLMLFIGILAIGLGIYSLIHGIQVDDVRWLIPLILGILLGILILVGLFVVNPNDSRVLILFGTYKGTVKKNGFFWANPFLTKKKITLRARNLNGEKLKVNDKAGNPIEIAAVVVWQVEETFHASFEVDDYEHYVIVQSEAAVRHLAYAPEIAEAMLRRQQASAVVAARTQIVNGAVSMVELALEKLAANHIVELDDERKAAMVSNLLVVLCSESSASPVVNAGTLYQ